jgi:hypothetical protein
VDSGRELSRRASLWSVIEKQEIADKITYLTGEPITGVASVTGGVTVGVTVLVFVTVTWMVVGAAASEQR